MNAKRHANGGGLVLDNAFVASSAYLGKDCVARDNARILGNAVVDGSVVVEGDALIDGYAFVSGISLVTGFTRITDYVVLNTNRKFDSVVLEGFLVIDEYNNGKRTRPANASASNLQLRRVGSF